jgi:hypothetical protein
VVAGIIRVAEADTLAVAEVDTRAVAEADTRQVAAAIPAAAKPRMSQAT